MEKENNYTVALTLFCNFETGHLLIFLSSSLYLLPSFLNDFLHFKLSQWQTGQKLKEKAAKI